ncbi:MAG TPA: shikimate kinase, partial [Clostridiaceae bacterium]|nr:shikimate kinase [Clostridiaceae bacterium]
MPGSGKSTLGKIISEKLKMEFVDTDDYIEEKTNLTISDLFKNGEEYFRKIETQAIFEIIDEG